MKIVKVFLLRAFDLPPAERWLAVEALATLAVARVVFIVLPFTQAMARLGLRPQFEETGAQPLILRDSPTSVAAVKRAVRRAAKIAPFRAVCLQQAVAASIMLRRRGMSVDVHFGVAKDKIGAIEAHAWSVCLGTVITGGFSRDAFVRIAVFTGQRAG